MESRTPESSTLTPKQGSLTGTHCEILEIAEAIVYTKKEKSILDLGPKPGFLLHTLLGGAVIFHLGASIAGAKSFLRSYVK